MRFGLAGAGLAIVLAWWVAFHYAYGVVVAASGLATAGFVVAVIGYRRPRADLMMTGLFVVAFVAPTGFAYLGNLVALLAAVIVALLQIARRTARHRVVRGQG